MATRARILSLHRLITAGMFAALICICTSFLKIPIPATGGYVHPGDALCLLAAATE